MAVGVTPPSRRAAAPVSNNTTAHRQVLQERRYLYQPYQVHTNPLPNIPKRVPRTLRRVPRHDWDT